MAVMLRYHRTAKKIIRLNKHKLFTQYDKLFNKKYLSDNQETAYNFLDTLFLLNERKVILGRKNVQRICFYY